MALTHISAIGNTLITTGPGFLGGVFINKGIASAVLTIYDGIDATGAVLAVVDCSVSRTFQAGWRYRTGLFVALSGGAADITLT